jgi:ABC-2 type transport system permease protein
METLRLYFKLIRIAFQARLQFRADFITGAVSVIFMNAINLSVIGVVLYRFQSLAGWSIWEIVFLYGLWVLGHSLFSLLFWHFDDLELYITEGTFDQFLTRPLSPFVQFLGREVNYTGIADLIVGLATFSLAMRQLGLHWPLLLWGFLLLAVLSGTLIELTLTLIFSSIAFWTGRSAASVGTVMRFSYQVQQYPLDMFGRGFRVIVTCFIPVAFMNYYPARLLLGKIPAGDPWGWLSFLSPLVALALVGVASLVWQRGLRQYSSSGS